MHSMLVRGWNFSSKGPYTVISQDLTAKDFKTQSEKPNNYGFLSATLAASNNLKQLQVTPNEFNIRESKQTRNCNNFISLILDKL